MSAAPRPVRVAVAEDEALLSAFLVRLLDAQPHLDVVQTADSQSEALARFAPGQVDVALLDIELAEGNGVALGRALQARDPAVRILLLSAHNMLKLVQSVSDRAPTPWSYLSKRSSTVPGELVRAVAAVAQGDVVVDPALVRQSVPVTDSPLATLSAAQFRVLQLVAEGYANGPVAERLGITPKAVERHLTAIYRQLDLDTTVNPRVAAVLAFLQQTVRPRL